MTHRFQPNLRLFASAFHQSGRGIRKYSGPGPGRFLDRAFGAMRRTHNQFFKLILREKN
ncbi:MAG: hypothetical protein ACLFWF_05795 [Alphaproteobacteria bacterium]